MKFYNRMVDVIIPAYNVPDEILFRCLSSIACQTIVNEIKVTIVDDASTTQNYETIAAMFRPLMDVQVLRYEVNGGPGVARQYGLSNTSNGLITFIDADDTFNGAFAIQALRCGIESDNLNVIAIANFDEIVETIPEVNGVLVSDPRQGPLIVPHDQDVVWMFGKMYTRKFIDKYNISFHPTSRANEDNGFNTLCNLCCNDFEKINFINARVYYWHENLNSITRQNNGQYSYSAGENNSFYGYVENMIYAITNAIQRKNGSNQKIDAWANNCMIFLYQYYIECVGRAPEHAPANFKQCKRFYDEVYSDVRTRVPPEFFIQAHDEFMRNAYINNKFSGFIPCMTITQFLDKLSLPLEEEDEMEALNNVGQESITDND